jgi:hypothetical protein
MLVNDIMIHIATFSDHFNCVVRLHQINKSLYDTWLNSKYQTLLIHTLQTNILHAFNKTKHAVYAKRLGHIDAFIGIQLLGPQKIIDKIYNKIPSYDVLKSYEYKAYCGTINALLNTDNSQKLKLTTVHHKMMELITKLIDINLGWKLEYEYAPLYSSSITIKFESYWY